MTRPHKARGWPMTTNSTRPALPTLQADQRSLISPRPGDEIERGLRDGFRDRREIVDWYQSAVVRTLGHITEQWQPDDLLRDRTLLTALITSQRRRQFHDNPMSLDHAAAYRRRLERVIVVPAFTAAFNDLRGAAGEYPEDVQAGGDDDDTNYRDPEGQEFVGMRPGFSVADDQQQAALNRLWGGFDSLDELLSWVHDLNEPTNGAIDESLASRIGRDRVAVEHMLGRVDAETPEQARRRARKYRERFAIVKLLPAFAEGVNRLEAGELATRTTDGLTPGGG